MKKLILVALFLLSSISYADNASLASEQESVKEAIQEYYIDALANKGDVAKIDEGFHPSFMLFGTRNDNKELWTWTIDEWKEGRIKSNREKGEYPRTGDDKFSGEIASIDINGALAVVKLKLYRGEKFVFIDYLSLYKLDGKWKLVSKLYHKIPKKD